MALSGWSKRFKVTVDSGKVDSGFDDFPLMIRISASSGIGSFDLTPIFDEVGANKKKIAVATAADVECYVEIEKWDDVGEDAILWVKIPYIASASDTELHIYYDSTHADNTTYVGDTTETPAQNVWDSYYEAVFHFGQDPVGAGSIKDSTGNGNHGTPSGMASGDRIDGLMGSCYDFDNTDYFTFPQTPANFSDQATCEILLKCKNTNNRGLHQIGAAVGGYYPYNTNQAYFDALRADRLGPINLSGSITLTAWHMLFFVNKNEANGWKANQNQTNVHQTTGETSVTIPSTCYVGSNSTGNYSEHQICEYRISSTRRSDAWQKATENACFDTLITYSIATIDGSLTEGATISSQIDAVNLTDSIAEGATISDQIDVLSFTDELTEGADIDDTAAAQAEYNPGVEDGVSISDSITAVSLSAKLTENMGMGDTAARVLESFITISEAAGISDTMECFNYTKWLAQNAHQLVRRYYFTLTGAPDGETDITIPIRSFQTRWKSADPTFLEVVIPGIDYSSPIASRSNGQMVIQMGYEVNGTVEVLEELIRVDLEDIVPHEGGRNRSIVLNGHRTITYENKTVALSGARYRTVSTGKLRYRCDPHLYLKPGDIAAINGDTFTVGDITMIINATQETMEIAEA